ncbi:glycosyltransferase family 25 protein [Aeromonas hydrophila]|nr:glycosyltransferase family 25 protein [Aeromonas hydrophila]
MKYETYVVSLKDELSRRTSIEKQLDRLDIKFHFIDAVDLRNISHDIATTHIKVDALNSIKRAMTKGEVGCALSHLECYENFVSSSDSDWAWIIEDDANLDNLNSESIADLLTSLNYLDIDVLILGYSKLSKDKESTFYKMEPLSKLTQSGDILIGMPWRNWTCGTVSYLIRRSGAEKMLAYFDDEKVSTVADDWLFFREQVNLNIAHCRPLLVFEDFSTFRSSLETERAAVSKRNLSFLDTIRVLRGHFRKILMKLIR